MMSRLIDTDGNKGQTEIYPAALICHYHLQHIVIQPDHESVLFKQVYKAAGIEEAKLLTLPADKGLRPDNPTGFQLILRLIENNELLLLQRLFHQGLYPRLEIHLAAVIFVIEGSLFAAGEDSIVGGRSLGYRIRHSLPEARTGIYRCYTGLQFRVNYTVSYFQTVVALNDLVNLRHYYLFIAELTDHKNLTYGSRGDTQNCPLILI